ncbi:hypothetical protein LSPH24S_08179 [Lysinibacillus sphaericus]
MQKSSIDSMIMYQISLFISCQTKKTNNFIFQLRNRLTFEWLDLLKMSVVFSLASCLALFFFTMGVSESNIITIYILSVLILAIWSSGWLMTIIRPGCSCTIIQLFIYRATIFTGSISSRLSDDIYDYVFLWHYYK